MDNRLVNKRLCQGAIQFPMTRILILLPDTSEWFVYLESSIRLLLKPADNPLNAACYRSPEKTRPVI
jgi:hypothetical protein